MSQVRLANDTFDFDWLLTGDDDAMFLRDNIVAATRGLDPSLPWHLTDDFPGPSGFRGRPTACVMDTAVSELGPDGCILTPAVAPCLRSVVLDARVCFSNETQYTPQEAPADQPGDVQVYGPHSRVRPGGGVWGYGQSGIVLSRGLVHSISEEDFRACELCRNSSFECRGGGDARLGECFFAFGANGRGIAPTLPFSNLSRHVFGHDLTDLLATAKRVVDGQPCDAACHFTLESVLTTSVHGVTEEEYRLLCAEFAATYPAAKRILRLGVAEARHELERALEAGGKQQA